jgi:hypothetical protein
MMLARAEEIVHGIGIGKIRRGLGCILFKSEHAGDSNAT